MTDPKAPKKSSKQGVPPPKGTRDLYPEDALRRRYVHQAWRDASIRCGFDEIAGPTFEHADLYAVKSGEGILNELFQAYSGKSPDEVEQVRQTGRAPYAMRPEFTPTLARMFAAKAGSLPRPCKWFTAGPYFRAERPQRGRLREFEQWNVDVIGLPCPDGADEATVRAAKLRADAECIAVSVALMECMGLDPSACRVHVGDRALLDEMARIANVQPAQYNDFLWLLDNFQKLTHEQKVEHVKRSGMTPGLLDHLKNFSARVRDVKDADDPIAGLSGLGFNTDLLRDSYLNLSKYCAEHVSPVWINTDPRIARGLAYYTGTVFEVIAEGERAVAGGGRYDKLIELMGGPPTPAVGFAMGDVVLSLLLDDKGLMPEGRDLAQAVSRPGASVRPDVFVIGADDDATDAMVRRLAADLRRGVESKRWRESDDRKPWAEDRYDVRPVHARVSYKSTRNLKKLLSDGEKQHARLAAIVHGEDRVQLRDLDARRDLTPADIEGLPESAAEFSVNPESPVYVGRAGL